MGTEIALPVQTKSTAAETKTKPTVAERFLCKSASAFEPQQSPLGGITDDNLGSSGTDFAPTRSDLGQLGAGRSRPRLAGWGLLVRGGSER